MKISIKGDHFTDSVSTSQWNGTMEPPLLCLAGQRSHTRINFGSGVYETRIAWLSES